MKKTTMLFIGILFLASLSFAQLSVTINAIEINDDDQTVYVTLTYNGTDYEFHGDTPIMNEADTLQYLITNKEEYIKLILSKMYPGADWKRFKTNENSNFQAIKDWISGGHKNLIGEDENGNPIYEVIKKKPFKSTHPKWVKLEKEIDSISNLAEAKAFLKKIVKRIK